MHFNFHLSGDESPEQSRRIANAVLALGGLLAQSEECQFAKETAGTVLNYGGAPTVSAEERAFLDEIMDRSEAQFGAQSDASPMEIREAGLSDIQREILRNPPDHCPTDTVMVDILAPNLATIVPPPVPTTPPVETKTSTTDHNGLPWDERIHSSSRAINADGTWRYRKNVPDETKRDVEAELRGLVQAPQLTEADLPLAAPSVPLPPTPPAPPVPTGGALQRTYSDVVNLIMARKVQPDTYVAILGMSLPEFARHVISAPNDATLMFDALDAASRSA